MIRVHEMPDDNLGLWVEFDSDHAHAEVGVGAAADVADFITGDAETEAFFAAGKAARKYRGTIAWLNDIEVTRGSRGEHAGSEMLGAVLAWLDDHGVRATFLVACAGCDGLDQSALVEWYERHGFKALWSGFATAMVRRK